ncbi:MAG: hypothetical protein WC484_08585 [Candidatus Omnitrophota bacterium]|jgi:hypothetical protein|nr:hypothetical protein [bacterium]
MKKYTGIILLAALFLALTGQLVFTAPQVEDQSLSEEAKKEIGPGYVYKGGNNRDPFIPLIGKSAGLDTAVGLGVKGLAAEVDIKLLSLKGYVFSQARKHALFKSADGKTYVLDRGKLVDERGLTVPGIAGIVKADKVVLITKKNVMREFKLREESE